MVEHLFERHPQQLDIGFREARSLVLVGRERRGHDLQAGRAPLAGYDDRYRVFANMNLTALDDWFDGFKHYGALRRAYGGRFILNTRPRERWVRSVMAHHARRMGRRGLSRYHELRFGTAHPAQVAACLRPLLHRGEPEPEPARRARVGLRAAGGEAAPEAAAAPAFVRRLIPESRAMLATSATSPRPPSSPRGKPSPRLEGRRANSRYLCIDIGGRRYYLDVRGTARWSSVTREMRYRSDCRRSGLESGASPRTAKRGS